MKKLLIFTLFYSVLFTQAQLTAAGQLPWALEEYKTQVRSVLPPHAPTDAVTTDYLNTCLDAAETLHGLEADDLRLSIAFDSFVNKRKEAKEKLPPSPNGSPAIKKEKDSFDKYLLPFREVEYLNFIKLQLSLLDRKYFKTETAKQSNFMEGYVNGRLEFTQAEYDDIKAKEDEHLGVSPIEAIFRLEPTVAFHDGAQPAVLGAAGLSYTFFPDVNRTSSQILLDETFLSKYLKKAGGRVGIGIGQVDNEARILLGAGAQVNAIAFWILYEPEGEEALFGVSMADLSVLKKVVGWFD